MSGKCDYCGSINIVDGQPFLVINKNGSWWCGVCDAGSYGRYISINDTGLKEMITMYEDYISHNVSSGPGYIDEVNLIKNELELRKGRNRRRR